MATLEGHQNSVGAVAVLPDDRIVSASDDRTLRVWDLASGEPVATLEGHQAEVRAVAVLPDGRIVSGSEDRTLRVWDLTSGRQRACLTLDGAATAIAVLPNRNEVVVAAGARGHLHHLRVEDL